MLKGGGGVQLEVANKLNDLLLPDGWLMVLGATIPTDS